MINKNKFSPSKFLLTAGVLASIMGTTNDVLAQNLTNKNNKNNQNSSQLSYYDKFEEQRRKIDEDYKEQRRKFDEEYEKQTREYNEIFESQTKKYNEIFGTNIKSQDKKAEKSDYVVPVEEIYKSQNSSVNEKKGYDVDKIIKIVKENKHEVDIGINKMLDYIKNEKNYFDIFSFIVRIEKTGKEFRERTKKTAGLNLDVDCASGIIFDYFDEESFSIVAKSFLKISYLLEQEASNKNLSLEDVEKNQKQLSNLERQIFDYRKGLDKKNVNYMKIMSSINIILDRIYGLQFNYVKNKDLQGENNNVEISNIKKKMELQMVRHISELYFCDVDAKKLKFKTKIRKGISKLKGEDFSLFEDYVVYKKKDGESIEEFLKYGKEYGVIVGDERMDSFKEQEEDFKIKSIVSYMKYGDFDHIDDVSVNSICLKKEGMGSGGYIIFFEKNW